MQSYAALLVILIGIPWLLLETASAPRNGSDWLGLYHWLKKVYRIVFAAAVLATLLRYSQ